MHAFSSDSICIYFPSSDLSLFPVTRSPQFFTPTHPLLALANPSLNLLTFAPLGVQYCLPSVSSSSNSPTDCIPGMIYQTPVFVPGIPYSHPNVVGLPGHPIDIPPPAVRLVLMPTPILDIALTGDVTLNHKPRPQPPGVAKTLESYPPLLKQVTKVKRRKE